MGWGGARPRKPWTEEQKVAARARREAAAGKPIATVEAPKPQQAPAAVIHPEPAKPIDPRGIIGALPMLEEMLLRSAKSRNAPRTSENTPFKLPWFPKHARPPQRLDQMAMDQMPIFQDAAVEWLGNGGFAAEGLVFLGYPYLAELAQRPEYRTMAETIADDATRQWIDFDVVGDEKQQTEERNRDPEGYAERMADPDETKKRVVAAGKMDRVKELKDDQERLELRDRLYWASTYDSYMGRSHLYLQIGDADWEKVDGEMAAPIGNGRDEMSRGKVSPQMPLRYIKTVEPVWTYPMLYNATNPLAPDWYNPQQWYVMGRQIHVSRLATFVTRPVPDMLKPAYAFGGLPLSQIAKPYVDIWLNTRQSVADLIRSFSTMVLQTDLSTLVQPGAATGLLARVSLYNMLRDNMGLFVTNKNTEDFKNVSAPLSGLHELQAQAQEHMLSVSRIPAVKFTGIQPAGLNASSEGEIKVYDDTIQAYEKRAFDPNLTRIINFEMLSLWGEVDPQITHRWNALRQLTDEQRADQAKKEAERDQVYVDMGAISPAEVRKKIIEDEDSPYAGLDPDDVPEPPQPEPGEGEIEEEGGGEEGEGPDATPDPPGGAEDSDPFGATDAAEWNEDDHPRGEGGKFTSGAGKGPSGKSKMPGLPDFLKAEGGGHSFGSKKQTLKMPQFGLTPTPWESHQPFAYKPKSRKPMPKSQGKPGSAGSIVAFVPGENHGVDAIGGVKFSSFDPPEDWADVAGQADISEPPLPELPKGMTMSTGVLIREKDGRVWVMRPKGGFGGYDQTFPKGGLEEGLSGQANAIKEAWEETGLKVKITGFAGDHEGDTSVTRFYTAEREGGDPADAGWESEGVILVPPEKLKDVLNRKRDLAIAASLSGGASQPVLDPADLKKVGGKMGTNEGGTFEDKQGNKFYIKRPQSKDHVKNELAAARLYQLAGVNTLNYREVKGGNHVATDLVDLDKNNISKMTPAERKEATKDFAVHAWLGNYDAAGTGGDNQGVLGGKVTTLDVGGSLRYRAQGAPKKGWGGKVTEIDTMRGLDPKIHTPDSAKLFGGMSENELRTSAERVTSIPDAAIRSAVGDDSELADILIERKRDLAKRFDLMAADEDIHEARAAVPRSLYVHRPLKNADAIHAWAKSQGFKTALPAHEMHVTVAFSKAPVKWNPLADGGGDLTQDAGAGGRSIQRLGDAIVLRFDSPALTERWQALKDQGASWDYPDYHPHVTITYEDGDLPIEQMQPYDGALEFGPEVFQEIKRRGERKHPHVALDEANFEESKHPRAPDGKFTSGAGGSGGSGFSKASDMEDFVDVIKEMVKGGATHETPQIQHFVKENEALAKEFAAQHPTSFVALALGQNPLQQTSSTPKSKKEIIGGLLSKENGTTVQEVLAATGWPSVSMPQQAAAVGMKLFKNVIEGKTYYKGVPMTDAEKADVKAAAIAAKEKKAVASVAEPSKPSYAGTNLEEIVKKAEAMNKSLPQPTPQELEKAKKNVALQMTYVPGAKPEMAGGQPMKDAEKLLKDFNDKYAGKTLITPAALAQKVNDFKMLQAGMAGLAQVEKAKHAEIAAQAKAAQAAKAKQMAEQAAAEAKANAEKNKVLMDELGIGQDQAEGLNALAKMLGQSNADLALAFKSHEAKAKSFGYPISGIEAATIMSYSDGSYGKVNEALRSGSWTPAQHVYVSMVNKALAKMPKHSGSEAEGTHLIRNTHLTAEQIAYYTEGHIVQEKALMSTSTKKPNGVFSGNVRFVITSKGKRGASIKKLSHYGSEDEVIFQAKTFFKVNKVEKLATKLSSGADTVIHLEEWEDL